MVVNYKITYLRTDEIHAVLIQIDKTNLKLLIKYLLGYANKSSSIS